jgi:hypothetical protein
MSITFPEGVIVRTGGILLTVYIAVLMVALFLGPLILLHGYRQWWLDVFDAGAAVFSIGGIIGHFGVAGRTGSPDHHG